MDQEMQINAVPRNLVTHDREFQGFVGPFAQDRDVDRRTLRALQQISNVAGIHVVSGLAVHRNNDVSGMNSRTVGRCSNKWRDDNHLVVSRADRHSHAVVLPALIFPQQRIGLWIEEIRVRIEHVQHAGNRAVVNRFIGVYRLGIILLDDVIDLCELLQALTDIGVAVVRRGRIFLGENHSQETTRRQK